MPIIELTKEAVTIVDENTFNQLSLHHWHLTSSGYAARRSNHKIVLMHRELLGIVENHDRTIQCDHINMNKLDNRLVNLRICNGSQNNVNQKPRNIIKGISFNKKGNTWRARISVNKKHILLGTFKNINDAISVYDEALTKYYGNFGRTNYESSRI